MAEAVIEVRDLVRTYHVGDIDIHALRGVSFGVRAGQLAIQGVGSQNVSVKF